MQYPDPQIWHAFYEVLGSSVAALVGLLYIVNSLHLHKLMEDHLLQRRAGNQTLMMMMIFLQAMAMLAPQSHVFLGAEICIFNAALVWFPVSIAFIVYKENLTMPVMRLGVTFLTAIVGLIGGLLLMANWKWSIHIVAASNVILTFILVAFAWSLMLGAWRTDLLKTRERERIGSTAEGAARQA